MMSLPVWLTGPMLRGEGLSLALCSFQGVSASSPMFLPGGGLPNLNLPEQRHLSTPLYVKERVVRMVLECIIVSNIFSLFQNSRLARVPTSLGCPVIKHLFCVIKLNILNF